MAGGSRRNFKVQRNRLKNLKKHIKEFMMMRRLGFDADMLFRTGGKAAVTYGQSVIGVATVTLRDQRRTAAACTATGGHLGAQNLHIAHMLADGSDKRGGVARHTTPMSSPSGSGPPRSGRVGCRRPPSSRSRRTPRPGCSDPPPVGRRSSGRRPPWFRLAPEWNGRSSMHSVLGPTKAPCSTSESIFRRRRYSNAGRQ